MSATVYYCKYVSGDQIKKNEVDGTNGTYVMTVEMHTEFWWGYLRERGDLEDLGVDRRIILNWIFKKWYGAAWTGSGPGQGQVTGDCKCGIEPSGSMKCGECLEQLRTC